MDEHLILRRLMWPLAATFVLLTCLVAVLLWHQEDRHMRDNLAQTISDISLRFQDAQTQQINIMSALLDVITADAELRHALEAGDRQRLLSLSQSNFEILRRDRGITHFYFQDRNRNNLLRVQFPQKSGGRIDRYTTLEAERTGQTVGGLEIGTYGILTLRVVKPVFSGSTLIGFVEFGREIDDLLLSLHPADHSIELAASLHKSVLQREAWQTGMKLISRQADWDRFPNDVISYSTLDHMRDELMSVLLQNYDESYHVRTDLDTRHVDGHSWRVTFLHLVDAGGRDIGDLAVMVDATSQHNSFNRMLLIAGAVVAGVLAVLMTFLYTLLRKTDEHLVAQQTRIHHIENQQKAIFDVAIDGIILINERSIIELCNPAAEAIFGYQAGELAGCNVNVLMPEPYHTQHDGYLHSYTHGGKAKIIGIGREVQGQRRDGSTFPMELAVSEAFIENRRQFVGVIRDITQHKLAEQELILARDEAEQASLAKSTFLSSMSHELRTPLNAVLGFGQLLEMSSDLDASKKDWVQEIMKAGHHLLRLVNDVLDLAKIESEQLSISLQPVEVCGVVEDCFNMLGPLAAEHRIRISHICPCGTVVHADPSRLKQVLLNLLSNAIKYNRPDGEVRIEVETVANQKLRISVFDTGRGIPADQFDALFQPFNRLAEEVGTIEGTGIGLTISLRMVELMGGMLGVESEMGVGSHFWIDLPLPPQEA